MFVVCTAIAFALLRSPVPAVLGGLAAMAADGYKPIVATFVIDDNLTIPLAGAAAMTLGLLLV
jgi:dolichol kinase